MESNHGLPRDGLLADDGSEPTHPSNGCAATTPSSLVPRTGFEPVNLLHVEQLCYRYTTWAKLVGGVGLEPTIFGL